MLRPRVRRRTEAASESPANLKSEINVTPLVDVVLVLLIVCMVVTPMLKRDIDVELPKSLFHDQSRDPSNAITVTLTSEKKLYVDAKEIAPTDDLKAALKRAIKKMGQTSPKIHFRADRSLAFGEARQALMNMRRAGATTIAIGTQQR